MLIKRTPYPMYYVDSPDYLGTFLETSVEVIDDDPAFVEFTGYFKFLAPDDLQNYIDSEQACYGLFIECSSTCMRQLIRCFNHFREKIDRNLLSDQVKVSPVIYAATDIDDFKHSNLAPDYENQLISIPKGGIIALSDETTVTISRGTPQNFESICKFQKSEFYQPYELDQDAIRIYLAEEVYDKYASMNRLERETVSAIYFPPVLIDIIQNLFITPDEELVSEYQSSKWYLSIEDRLEYMGDWHSMSAFDIAMDIIEKLQEDGVVNMPVQGVMQ